MPSRFIPPSSQRITSNSYFENDKTKKKTVSLSDIRMSSVRDFDTMPTVMSSSFLERGQEVRDGVLSAYSKYGAAASQDPMLRSSLDLAMSLVLNKPYDDVARNHDTYKLIFTGQDLDDKSLGTAMVDAWNSDAVANDIARLQRMKDATDDQATIDRLEEQIRAKERDAIRLGDYSAVRSWFGDQLIKSAQIAPQVIEGASRSALMALAFAGLSAALTPAGAAAALGASSGISGTASMLGYLRTLASTAHGAAQIGSAIGTAHYLATDVLPREYGTMSRQLESFVDEYGNHMDKETRKKAAAIYAVASTFIEFATPEPGFGKLLYGLAPKQMISRTFTGWLKRVGVNMVQGGVSESIEEALQDFLGSFVQDVAANSSDRKGNTEYNVGSYLENIPAYVTQAFKTFSETLVPSMLVGAPGAITSSSVASYLTNVANEHDSIFREVSEDANLNAIRTQNIGRRTVIASADVIDMQAAPVDMDVLGFNTVSSDTASNAERANTDISSAESQQKLPAVKVRFDRQRGRYVPIDGYNSNLAKYLYVNLKNDAVAIDVVNDGSVRLSADDLRNVVEISGGAVRNGVDIVFRNTQDAERFVKSLGNSAVSYRDNEGNLSVEYTDVDGNTQVSGIEINEGANIEGIIEAEAKRRSSSEAMNQESNAENRRKPADSENKTSENAYQESTNQNQADSEQELSDAIRTASQGNITKNAADALARLFYILPENVRNSIFQRNNGKLVLSEAEYERITGRKVGNENRALSMLKRLQMVLTGKSDASSFVHEMGHIVLIANPELVSDIRLAFGVNLDTEEGLNTFLSFIDENKDIINVKSRESAAALLKGIGNIDANTAFSENQEELVMSMLEAHFRTDLRKRNMTMLPQNVQEVFQKVADAIRRVYGRATGKTELPQDVQDVFNSFFWGGSGNDSIPNNDIIRNQSDIGSSNISTLLESQPVYVSNNLMFQKSDKSFKDMVLDYYTEKYGNSVIRDGREVLLDKASIDDSFYHKRKLNRYWVSAYAAVPEVIKNGLSFSYEQNWKGRGYDSELIAAPAILADGVEDIVLVVVTHKEGNPSRFYLHSIIDKKSLREVQTALGGLPEGNNMLTLGGKTVNVSDLPPIIQTLLSQSSTVKESDIDIRTQRALGEDAVDSGQKKYMRMDDARFERSIEKDIFLPNYVVKAKLESENEDVRRIAQQELNDRDKFSVLSSEDVSQIFDFESAEEYANAMKDSGSLKSMNEADADRIYRKAWNYAHVMTPKEMLNSFKQRFNTLPKLMELKRILGPRQVQATSPNGNTYTRLYVPTNSRVYQLLSRLDSNSPIELVNQVLSSIDSNPREWIHAYQQAVNAGARIAGTLTEDQDIIDNYIDMADSDFDIIKKDIRRGEEPFGVSSSTVYGVSDADIVGMSVEDAERARIEAGDTEAVPENITAEEVQSLKDSAGIAKRAASDALDRARQSEAELDAYKQKYEADTQQMKDTIQVLRKSQNRKASEVKQLKEKLESARQNGEAIANNLRTRLVKAEADVESYAKRIVELDGKLRHRESVYNKRIDEYRRKIDDARTEAKRQTARANKLNRRLVSLAIKTASDRVTRAIKGKLNLNSKTHDVAYLQDSLYYVYYLLHDGQNRRFSDQVSTESEPDADWDMDRMMAGRAEGMTGMDEQGNPQPIILDIGHTDENGKPITNYSGNLGAYRYERKNIPAELKSHLDPATVATLEADGRLRWRDLTVAEQRDIYKALDAVKTEARNRQEAVTDKRQAERRSMSRDAAQESMSSTVGEITEEMRSLVLSEMKKADPKYSGTPTDEQVWDYISKHPKAFANNVEVKGLKKLWNGVKMQFLKIQRIAKILDHGKDDGPFQRIFVKPFWDAYDAMTKDIDRRSVEFQSALEGIIGKKGSKEYSKAKDDLKNVKMHFRTRALTGDGVDLSLNEVMGLYIYSQNINGFKKLVSVDGNNMSLEDIARVNPEAVKQYIDLELALLADKNRDPDHPTPLAHEKHETLIDVRNRIESGEVTNEVPDWVRSIGDTMIDLLNKEMPRVAEAAYLNYNTLLEIQERYFPLTQASRSSWGDFSSMFKGKNKQVNSGMIIGRQKNARYPLLLDPMSTFLSAIREQENMIHMSKPVSDAQYALHFGSLEKVVTNRYGDRWAKALTDYVNRMAGQENHLTDVEKLMNRFLGNAAAAKIGLNLMTAVKQFVSLIPAAVDGELSPLDVMRGIARVISPSDRQEIRTEMDRLAYSVLRSGYDADISRLRNIVDSSRLDEIDKSLVDKFTILTKKGDDLSKMIVWSAKFDKEMRAGRSESDAAYAASDLVNRTMSVSNPMSLAAGQASSNPLARAFFMFTNDLFQMWNVMFGDIPLDWRNKNYSRAFSRFGGLALTAAALGLLAGGWLPDDDDDKDKLFSIEDFIGDFIENMLGYSFPIVGQQASDWLRGYSSQSMITAPSEFFNTLRMVYNGTFGDKEYTADEYFDQVMDTLFAIGETAGVPATGLKRPAQSVYDFDSGEWRLNLGYLFGTRWGDGGPNLMDNLREAVN